MKKVKPLFKHDCDNCVFLGSYKCDDIDYDLYFCDGAGVESHPVCFLARYSDVGSEYLASSYPETFLEDYPLFEAKKRYDEYIAKK